MITSTCKARHCIFGDVTRASRLLMELVVDSKAIYIDALRLFWKHRIAVMCLVFAASVMFALATTIQERKSKLTYHLVVNSEVARPASLFQMIGDFPAIRAHVDDDDGDGLNWSVSARRNTIHIPGVTIENEMAYKKIMDDALQHALQRVNSYSSDVIETSELARSQSTGNASEFARDVLKAKLFNRYFENDRKMIAYFNIDVKDSFALPTWLLIMLYIPLTFGIVGFLLIVWVLWRQKGPEFIAFFKTEIANEKA